MTGTLHAEAKHNYWYTLLLVADILAPFHSLHTGTNGISSLLSHLV